MVQELKEVVLEEELIEQVIEKGLNVRSRFWSKSGRLRRRRCGSKRIWKLASSYPVPTHP